MSRPGAASSVAAALVATVVLAYAATSMSSSPPRRPGPAPRHAAAHAPPSHLAAPPIPAPRPRRAPLWVDPYGPFFGVVGKRAFRFSLAQPGPKVALIFDDGPGPQTLAVLRALRRAGARATFFLVGREVALRPGLVRALRDAGMELGSHTWSHALMSSLDARGQRGEVALASQVIRQVAGVQPRLFRPPDLAWNETTVRAASSVGELGVLHTIDTFDWARPGRGVIARAAEVAGPGDIVALHDAGGDRTQTVAAIRPIVRALRRRGLECVTISELLGDPAPRPAHGPRGVPSVSKRTP